MNSMLNRKVFRLAALSLGIVSLLGSSIATNQVQAVDSAEHSDLTASIKRTIESWDDYWNQQELDSFLKYHLADYVDNDGLDLEKAKSNAKELWKEFPNCKVKTRIKQISFSDGDNASVEYEDELHGPTPSRSEDNLGDGTLTAKSGGTLYLRNVDGVWRLARAHFDWEEQTLRYGRAIDLPVRIEAAPQLKPGTIYFAKLKFSSPSDARCFASIRKKLIGGPAAKDAWRNMPECGVLEREFHANSESKNELICGTIGIASRENRKKLAGLAIVSRRINIVPAATATSGQVTTALSGAAASKASAESNSIKDKP